MQRGKYGTQRARSTTRRACNGSAQGRARVSRIPVFRGLIKLYRPVLDRVLRRPKITLLLAALVFVSAAWPVAHLGGELMPPLNEGDLLYMPSALPGLPASKASELLQITDRLEMFETTSCNRAGREGRAGRQLRGRRAFDGRPLY
jgi:Cu/Ag efflux pump CusA